MSLGAVAALAAAEIASIGPGAWPVGSSNFEANEKPPAPMIDYLKGRANAKEQRYIADVLANPAAALVTEVQIPDERARFGNFAGTKMPLALYVLYPTTAENPRAAYKFPYPDTGDNEFPHMQRAGEKPIFAASGAKWPLIVFSHGYEGHGLWDLEQLKVLASHGYIVVSVFHGDGRKSLESGVNFRPLELKAALDFILRHPDFGPAIDPEKIGVSGSSFGGYAVLAALGGKYLPSRERTGDPRIKAGFGLVPFMGERFGFWPFTQDVWPFGKDFAGLREVRTPFLAVYGEKDTNVHPRNVEAGVAQIAGTASAVMLDGEKHLVSKAVLSDVYTWEILFFDAWLKGDTEARKKLYGATSVAGGVHDHRTYLHAGPNAAVHTLSK